MKGEFFVFGTLSLSLCTRRAQIIALVRWGDAPVRTLAAAMFLKRDQIHFFNDIGYAHSVAEHCPVTMDVMHRCSCDIYQTYGKDICAPSKEFLLYLLR